MFWADTWIKGWRNSAKRGAKSGESLGKPWVGLPCVPLSLTLITLACGDPQAPAPLHTFSLHEGLRQRRAGHVKVRAMRAPDPRSTSPKREGAGKNGMSTLKKNA